MGKKTNRQYEILLNGLKKKKEIIDIYNWVKKRRKIRYY